MGGAYFSGGGKVGFYRRLSWDKPSPTVTTSPHQKATDMCHPEELRPLSVRECARIQTFPDDWVFYGSTASKYRQIGNAVPVLLAKAIGEHIYKLSRSENVEENSEIYQLPLFQYSNVGENSKPSSSAQLPGYGASAPSNHNIMTDKKILFTLFKDAGVKRALY